jgi:hypothetical protein
VIIIDYRADKNNAFDMLAHLPHNAAIQRSGDCGYWIRIRGMTREKGL